MKNNFLPQIVETQLSDYHRLVYPLYGNFLKAYYEYMALAKNPYDVSKNLIENRKTDDTLEEFLSFFQSEYLDKLPSSLAVDKRLLIKRVLSLYQSKGNANSIKSFFKIVFNENVNVVTPYDNVLIASGGKWSQENFVTVKKKFGAFNSPSYYENLIIRVQNETGIYSVKIKRTEYFQRLDTYRFFFENFVSFSPKIGDTLDILSASNTIVFRGDITPSVNRVKIVQRGKNFKEGLLFLAAGTFKDSLLRIKEVDDDGRINSIEVTEHGLEHGQTQSVSFSPYLSKPLNAEVEITRVTISPTVSNYTINVRDSLEGFSETIQGVLASPQSPTSYFEEEYALFSELFNAENVTSIVNEATPKPPVFVVNNNVNLTLQEYNDSIALVELVFDAVASTPGRYVSTDSLISNPDIRLQDNYYYQKYSYAVETANESKKFKDFFDELIHPSGLKRFFNFKREISLEINPFMVRAPKQFELFFDDSMSLEDAASKTVYKSLSEIIPLQDQIYKTTEKNLLDTFLNEDFIAKTYEINTSSSFQLEDSTSNSVTKGISDSINMVDTQTSTFSLSLSDSFSASDVTGAGYDAEIYGNETYDEDVETSTFMITLI